jgi:hypothetical protein
MRQQLLACEEMEKREKKRMGKFEKVIPGTLQKWHKPVWMLFDGSVTWAENA